MENGFKSENAAWPERKNDKTVVAVYNNFYSLARRLQNIFIRLNIIGKVIPYAY